MVEKKSHEPTGEGEDGLLAAAEQLAGVDDGGERPRMRRGRARRRGRTISEDGAETLREPGGVRSTAHEGGVGEAPAPAPEPEMLDASGAVLPPDAAVPRPAAARAIDAGAVLAEAVRSYMNGLDTRGAGDEVTQDRLDRLRRTLEQYDQAT